MKVFLVEDEKIIRESVKQNIAWKEEGFDFAGEASDGEIAFPMIQTIRPDIVITDIKMPFTDGLELSRLVKNTLPDTKIIILSGYSDFNYAKQAINIGVTEYLLKPISSERLLAEVKRVADKIREERKQLEYLRQFQQEMKEQETIEKQKFFNKLIFKELSLSEILEQATKLHMNLTASNYNILLFKVFVIGETATCYSEKLNEITEEVLDSLEQLKNCYMFDRGAEGWAFLVTGNSEQDVIDRMYDLIQKMKDFIVSESIVQYFGGIGKLVSRLSELPISYDKANEAFSYRYIGMPNQIVDYQSLKQRNEKQESELNVDSIAICNMNRSIIDNFLRTGSQKEVQHFINDYFKQIGSDNINSLLFRQYIVMDLYISLNLFLKSLGDQEEHEIAGDGFKRMKDVFNSVEQSKKFIEESMIDAIIIRNRIMERKNSGLIRKAKDYIKETYNYDDISLNRVAASVNISPSYFSSIFSQEEGKTFIEYLTEVRMEKAKELLICSNRRTSDIGFEIGYKDPHYFSYLFKKTQNCTPKEYRLKGRQMNHENQT